MTPKARTDESAAPWRSIATLKRLWLERSHTASAPIDGAPPARTEGAYSAVTEDLVEAIASSAGDRLVEGQQGLRQIYAVAMAQRADLEIPVEAEPGFE